MSYVFVKWLHVVSSTIVFGTGIGSAFYFLCAALRREPATLAFVASIVVVADWLFTATTMVLQPLSGVWLARTAHFPWDSFWLRASVGLYVLAALCWLPVVVLQIRMRDMARRAVREGDPLPAHFDRLFLSWVALGVPALFAFLAIFWLMVAKPA